MAQAIENKSRAFWNTGYIKTKTSKVPNREYENKVRWKNCFHQLHNESPVRDVGLLDKSLDVLYCH